MKTDTIKVKIAMSLRVGTVDNRLQNLSLFDWLTDVQHMCTFRMAEADFKDTPPIQHQRSSRHLGKVKEDTEREMQVPSRTLTPSL